nr:unnamed protein product [Digitaria exilis]
MRPHVLLVALAALAVLAALPLAQSKGEGFFLFVEQFIWHEIGEHGKDDATTAAGAWPCCDTCGTCTRSLPPRCTCMDTAPSGCNAACKSCVKTSLGGSNVFRCADRVANLCKRRCTPAA